jgi:hypothetical protein
MGHYDTKKAKEQKIAKLCELEMKIDLSHFDTWTRL